MFHRLLVELERYRDLRQALQKAIDDYICPLRALTPNAPSRTNCTGSVLHVHLSLSQDGLMDDLLAGAYL